MADVDLMPERHARLMIFAILTIWLGLSALLVLALCRAAATADAAMEAQLPEGTRISLTSTPTRIGLRSEPAARGHTAYG